MALKPEPRAGIDAETELLYSSDGTAGGNFTSVGYIYGAVTLSADVPSIDATHSKSPGKTRRYLPGPNDSGTITFNMDYDPSSDETKFMLQTKRRRLTKYWRLTDANGSRREFLAFISNTSENIPLDDRISMDVTLQISGPSDVK